MPISNTVNKEYSDKLKKIRPFVDFNYDLRKPLSSASKGKINRYHDYINSQLRRETAGMKVYRPRSKKHLDAANKAAGAPPNLKGLKVSFLNTGGQDVKIKFAKNGDMILKTKHVDTQFIDLDPEKLVGDDAQDYIKAELKKRRKFRAYSIKYGEFDAPSMPRDDIPDEVAKLAARYDVAGNHNYRKWLTGVTGLSFKNQSDQFDFAKARREAVIKRKKK